MKKTINKTLIKIVFSLSCLIFINPSFGQDSSPLDAQTFADFLSLQSKGLIKRAILSESDILGSPYLNKEFILGNIITKTRIQYVDVPLRYNIYNDDMEFEVGENDYLAISNPKGMKEVRIGESVFVYDIKRKH